MTCIMAAVGVVLASLVGVDGLATGVSTEGTMSLLGLTDADADGIFDSTEQPKFRSVITLGACSTRCGRGTQTESAKCYNKETNVEVAPQLCDVRFVNDVIHSCIDDSGCIIPSNPDFEKRPTTGFGVCDVDNGQGGCGSSVRLQNIVCYSKATDMQVDIINCLGLPDLQLQTEPCTVTTNCYNKIVDWGACSNSGIQTAIVECHDYNREVVSYLCDGKTIPTRSCNNPSNGLPPQSDSAESIQCAVGEYEADDRSCKSCPSVGNCASNECSGPTKGEQQCSACKGGFKLAINSEGGNWCQVRNRCPRGQFPGNDGECVGCPAKWKPKNCEDHFCVGLSKKKETRCGQCAKNFAVSENKRWCKYKPDQV